MSKGRRKPRPPHHSPLLGKPQTRGYKPSVSFAAPSWSSALNGTFDLSMVEDMCRDSHTSLCLEYRKAPIHLAETIVVAPGEEEAALQAAAKGQDFRSSVDPKIKGFVGSTYRRFWGQSLRHALHCFEYGHQPGEAMYVLRGGRLHYHGMMPLYPEDAIPYTLEGTLAYLQVGSVPPEKRPAGAPAPEPVRLDGPSELRPAKGLWFVHDSGYNPLFGRSCLRASWWPWRLKTMPDGLIEVIFKWAYRHSLGATVVRHPDVMVDGPSGPVHAQDLARQMVNELKAGADITLNSNRDDKGEYQWLIEQWAKAEGTADGLIGVSDWLDKMIQRGIGIPDEVITHDGNVGGYSRSQVAVVAFFVTLESFLNYLIEAIGDQIAHPLVRLNQKLGTLPRGDFAVVTKPLLPPDKDDNKEGAGQPAPPPGGGPKPPSPALPSAAPTPGMPKSVAMSRSIEDAAPVAFYARLRTALRAWVDKGEVPAELLTK